MQSLITYTPRAPLNQVNAPHAPRLQGMRLQTPIVDTVTPQVIARAGAQLGHAMTAKAEKMMHEQSVALALETMQEADKELIAFENDYMQTKRGKDAATATQEYETFLTQTQTAKMEKLKGDSNAASLFNVQFGRTSMAAIRSAGNYSRQQDEQWRSDVAQGEAASLMQRVAMLDDQGQIAAERADYKAKLSALMPGRDLTAHMAKLDTDLAENMINRKLAQEDFGGASALLQKFRGELGGKYDETLAKVTNSQRSASLFYEAQNEKQKKIQAVTTAQSLVQKFGGDSAQAQDWIQSNAKNTEERLLFTSAYINQRNVDDAMQQQIRQESYISTQAKIGEDIKAAGRDVVKLNEILSTAPPEHQQYAMAHAEQAVGKQRRAISDPVALDNARQAIIHGTPYEMALGANAGKISDPDASHLKNLSENQQAREAESKDTLYFDNLFQKSRYAKLGTSEKAAARAQLKQEYFEQTRGVRTLAERNKIAFELIHDRTVIGTFRDSTVNSIKAREYPSEKLRIAVPDAARTRIEDDAKAQGLSLTDEQIEAAYILNRAKLGY